MDSLYEDERIPLQIRRLLIFSEVCRKARKHPDEIVYLNSKTKLAFSVIYFDRNNKYVAYGGVFKYAHTRKEVLEKELDKTYHDEFVMCAMTISRQAFTKPAGTLLALLWQWNKYVKNRPHNYVNGNPATFFLVNDELEKDYLPYKYHNHLLAIKNLPLWDNYKN